MNASRHAGHLSVRSAVVGARLPLPRDAARGAAGRAVWGFGTPLALAVVGAMLVHIVEYHLGLGTASRRLAAIQFMLAHCPIRGGLLVVGLCAALTVLALLRELCCLLGQRRRLTRLAERAGVATRVPAARTPLHPERLIVLLLTVLGGQVGLYALLAHVWPMIFAMRMHGVLMDMAVPGAAPLLPLHLGVATLLTAIGWSMERRFQVLHAVIGAVRRLLARLVNAERAVPLPACAPAVRLSGYGGPGALARPPPA